MLKELKFVQGAVSKKDFIPAMTHFAIEAGTVRAYNGVIALGSPLPFDIDCKPKADALVKAIGNCGETIALAMTTSGRLKVSSGSFKAFIECVQEETPHVQPEGEPLELNGEAVLQAIKVISPFIGDDASRPWSNGVLLRDGSAFATNNVCLVQYWIGAELPATINIPRAAIKEMLRINEAPTHAQLAQNSITFHYADSRWVRTQLLESNWPDLSKVLDRTANVSPVSAELFTGLESLRPFADKLGRVYFKDGVLRTVADDGEGASYEMENFPYEGIYQIEMLRLLNGVALQVDFGAYPDPCVFYGDQLRGAIVGMRA